MPPPPLLEVRQLRRSFGGVVALAGADLGVPEGSITGLIGPNGAGKTTLFNVVTGALAPDGGSVAFAGRDVTGWRPDQLARAGLARTFQIARGLAGMTVLENLMVYGKDQPGEAFVAAILRPAAARRHEDALRDKAVEIMRRLDILAVADNRAADLSGGQKKLLELGRVLMSDPRMVMLDEPAAGVNPSLARRIAGHILDLRRGGITFLLIEHNMGMVAELCDRVVVLAEGRNLADGSFADVRSDPRVQSAYLGQRP
ncbi:MAG: ABC transporter ATP-binding protein [Alphaproteobacteria bacterium]|jgi:ABC-type branched-subunit amino acid transport system ATPase component